MAFLGVCRYDLLRTVISFCLALFFCRALLTLWTIFFFHDETVEFFFDPTLIRSEIDTTTTINTATKFCVICTDAIINTAKTSSH